MSDPTAEALAAFNDTSAWDDIKQDVPIFVAHERTVQDPPGPDGRPRPPRKIVVDEQRLRVIAANMKRLQDKDRQPIAFHEGHTRNPLQFSQQEQPDILAYGINPRVGTWNGRPAILVQQFVLRGCLDRVKKLPYRSAEFYDRENQIPAVALLKTQPWLNLGMILYQRPDYFAYQHLGRACLYMRDDSMPDPTMPPDAAAPDLDFDTKVGKSCEKYMSGKYPHLGAMHQKYAESLTPPPVLPGSTNTDMPGDDTPEKAEYQRLRAENIQLQRQLAYGRELTALVQRGVKFDYGRELNYACGLTPEQFTRHKELLTQASAPVGGGWLPTSSTGTPAPVTQYGKTAAAATDTEENFERAVQYMRAKNCSWEEAEAAVYKK